MLAEALCHQSLTQPDVLSFAICLWPWVTQAVFLELGEGSGWGAFRVKPSGCVGCGPSPLPAECQENWRLENKEIRKGRERRVLGLFPLLGSVSLLHFPREGKK